MRIQRVERTNTKHEQSAYVVCNLCLCWGPMPHYTARIRLACQSAGYSVHWGTSCFMRLISMPWEPGDGGSAGDAIFAMIFVGPDSRSFTPSQGTFRCALQEIEGRAHTHKDISASQTQGKTALLQRNITYNYLEYDMLHVSAIWVYRQITVSIRRGRSLTGENRKKVQVYETVLCNILIHIVSRKRV